MYLKRIQIISSVMPLSGITGVIKLDPGKYLREIVAKYDMTDTIPLPAGRKIYMNEEWNGDENLRNLYQQIAGSLSIAPARAYVFSFSIVSRDELPDPRESVSRPACHQVRHRIVGSENHLSP